MSHFYVSEEPVRDGAFVIVVAGYVDFDVSPRLKECIVGRIEALTNAIRYGAPQPGDHPPAHRRRRRQLAFVVQNSGPFVTPGAEPDGLIEGGRGLPFMHLLMDELELDIQPGSTTVRMRKRRQAAETRGRGERCSTL